MNKQGLQKKVLQVRDSHGSHRQTYYVKAEDPKNLTFRLQQGHRIRTTTELASPSDRVSIHYGLIFSRKANQGVDHAMEAIGKVHGVPKDLHKLPVHVVHGLEGDNGMYTIWGHFEGSKIEISRYSAGSASTLAHEYGHFLDHHLFGTGKPELKGLATEHRSKELQPLMHAIYRSQAAKNLVAKHEEHGRRGDWKGREVTEYLLDPAELFARSYAQWIGVRASPQIHRENMVYKEHWQRRGYDAQWDDADFEPIAREFDRLFQNRRLLRKRTA